MKYIVNKIYDKPELTLSVEHTLFANIKNVRKELLVCNPMPEGNYPAGIIALGVDDDFVFNIEEYLKNQAQDVCKLWLNEDYSVNQFYAKIYRNIDLKHICIEFHETDGKVTKFEIPVEKY